MVKTLYLFIDESGSSSPVNKQSGLYILCGCAVKEDKRGDIKIFADKVKFKYWENKNVIFHSRDIGKNLFDFRIFSKSLEKRRAFIKDLLLFLDAIPITTLMVVVDKDLARRCGWNEVKIIK